MVKLILGRLLNKLAGFVLGELPHKLQGGGVALLLCGSARFEMGLMRHTYHKLGDGGGGGVCACVCVCVHACVCGVCVCVCVLRIVATDKISCFVNASLLFFLFPSCR